MSAMKMGNNPICGTDPFMGQSMKNILTVAVLAILACGCASLVTNRGVEVKAASVAESDGLDIFRNAAGQLGLIVQGPVYETTHRYYYEAWPPTALPPTNQVNKLSFAQLHFFATLPPANQVNNPLHLLMDDDDTGDVTFCAVIHGTAKDFPVAQAAAALFEQELDKRHIKYKVWQATSIPPP
jgi:hypothetical protein